MVQIETYDYNEKVVLCVVPNSPNTMIILLTCIEPGQSIFTGKKINEKDQPGAQKYRSQDDFASWFAQDSPHYSSCLGIITHETPYHSERSPCLANTLSSLEM